MANEIVTHPFETRDGRRARVVDPGDGGVYLELGGGISACRTTGPEILKLAAEGSLLWKALWVVLQTLSPYTFLEFRALLDQTASTFDHNEPEEPIELPDDVEDLVVFEPKGRRPTGLGFDHHLPECPKSCGSISGCICRDDAHEGATREPDEVSLKRDAPIPLVPEVEVKHRCRECGHEAPDHFRRGRPAYACEADLRDSLREVPRGED